MKTKTLLLVALGIFTSFELFACPVWMIGKIRIVDENNKPVNAKIWKFVSKNDSFQMDKSINYRTELHDTDYYAMYSGGGWGRYDYEDRVAADYYLRIQAEGYADVTLKSLDYNLRNNRENYPVLVVKMYSGRFIKSGEQMTLINQYAYNQDIIVDDSTILGYQDYITSLGDIELLGLGNHGSLLAVESYPNPVLEHMTIKINSEIIEPYILKLMDSQGKLIRQTTLTAAETKYDLQWQAAGRYILMVLNPEGKPIFSRQFVKI